MSYTKLDEFLRNSDSFTLEKDSTTRLNKHRKLLLGSAIETDIGFVLPTDAKYSWSNRQLRATYLFSGVMASGIGIIDEWRELPSDIDFNTYGFDYVPGESYRFRSCLASAEDEHGTRKFTPVELTPFTGVEQQRIEQLTLSRAFIDLALDKTLITATITTNE